MKLDPRRHAFRPDLADEGLKDRIEAPRFVKAEPAQVAVPVAAMRSKPDAGAALSSEVLYGEALRVFERRDGWAWVQCETDLYVGYVREDILGAVGRPSHRVRALRATLHPIAALKSPPVGWLPMQARLAVIDEANGYARMAGGAWISTRHIAPLDDAETSPLETASLFLGTPYLWGGRSADGIDCSGLVQIAHTACGIAAPRDSDMQAAEMGEALPLDAERRAGDLVFFPGHVGIMADGEHLLHANAHHMAVTIDRLETVIARGTGAGVTALRRLAR